MQVWTASAIFASGWSSSSAACPVVPSAGRHLRAAAWPGPPCELFPMPVASAAAGAPPPASSLVLIGSDPEPLPLFRSPGASHERLRWRSGDSKRRSMLFEDAVEGSPTASAPPAPWREGEAAAAVTSLSISPPSVSIPEGDAAADEDEEAYESPSASGHPAIDGAEGPPSVSGSGQCSKGTEEGYSTAGSPVMEGSRPRSASAPSSPGPPGVSSSPVPPQTRRHVRTSSFQRFRQQMLRAWKWGPVGGAAAERSPTEQLLRTMVNIEAMANQKRQWYQLHSKALDQKQFKEPTSLFEHFFVVGLHSYANVALIEDAFAKKKAWEST